MGKGKVLGIVLAVVLIIIILGLIVYAYQLKTVAENVEVSRATVVDADLEGLSKVVLTIRLYINNPSGYDVEVSKIYYNVYINDEFFGSGVKENIYVPAGSEKPIDIKLEVPGESLVSVLWSSLKNIFTNGGKIDYDITGRVVVPVKLFGAIRMGEVEAPYSIPGEYEIPKPSLPSIGFPSNGQTTTPRKGELVVLDPVWFVNGMSSEICKPGDQVTVYIVVIARKEYVHGTLTIVVRRDIRILPDQDMIYKNYEVSLLPGDNMTYSISFTVPNDKPYEVEGYFIEVYLDGEKIYSTPNQYPPRLKLS